MLCGQGFPSRLVAAQLRRLGFGRATDVIGGFAGRLDAGLPVEPRGGGVVTHAVAGGPGDALPGTYA